MRSRNTFLFLLVGFASSSAERYELELLFWPGKGATKDSRLIEITDHPCGKVASARVTAIPGYAPGGSLVAEVAVEVNSAGKVVRRWPISVDSRPIAVSGERLLLDTNDLKFWVDLSRTIARYDGKESLPQPGTAPCQRASDFKKTAYFSCQVFTDLVSRKERIIQFQTPCT